MADLLEILQYHPRPYVTDAELEVLLDGTADSRYGKVKRLLAQGKLLHIRRGLYCIPDLSGNLRKPHPFELAQYIYGPSYISLESALGYHGLIPEAVYTITSVTGKRRKKFETSLGVFDYLHLPNENLYLEVELIEENGCRFFMAKPWKAICDYVFCYKKEGSSLRFLVESMRINPENLPVLRDEEIDMLQEYYHHNRINQFLKNIRKELNT